MLTEALLDQPDYTPFGLIGIVLLHVDFKLESTLNKESHMSKKDRTCPTRYDKTRMSMNNKTCVTTYVSIPCMGFHNQASLK